MLQAGERSHTWTSFNKVDTVKKKNAQSQFRYDANHNRIKQTSTITASNAGKIKATLYIDKTFEKITRTGNLSDEGFEEYKHYIYAGGKVVAMQTRTKKEFQVPQCIQNSCLHLILM